MRPLGAAPFSSINWVRLPKQIHGAFDVRFVPMADSKRSALTEEKPPDVARASYLKSEVLELEMIVYARARDVALEVDAAVSCEVRIEAGCSVAHRHSVIGV